MTNEVQPIEIEEFAKRGEKVPPGQRYIIRVDKEKITVHVDRLTGRQILELVKKTPETFKLYEHGKGRQPREVLPDEVEVFTEPGIERFSTLSKDTTEGLC
jgi:hypothetical protein